MQLRHSIEGVCNLEQVRLAPPHLAPEKNDGRVTLDTRALGMQVPCASLNHYAKADIKTNRAAMVWDSLNGHHGLHTSRFEITP